DTTLPYPEHVRLKHSSGHETPLPPYEPKQCIDYILYYPDQRLPNGGACGFFACDGSILSYSELEEDSDFNRTFGILDTCTSSANREVRHNE
ncbi:unnamed protein product, partial [Ectocarpus sp. 12 AP-2014]